MILCTKLIELSDETLLYVESGDDQTINTGFKHSASFFGMPIEQRHEQRNVPCNSRSSPTLEAAATDASNSVF